MNVVTGLVTLVDLLVANDRQVSFSARHEAVLSDGRRLILLDDRGWTSSTLTAEGPDGVRRASEGGVWDGISAEEIHKTARTVVGPDEPVDGHSYEEADAAHWDHLARVLGEQGLTADAADLKALPHDVVLSERL